MKAVKLITKILVVVLIALIAFLGVYVQKQNRMENQVKDYTFGMDLDGVRRIVLKVSEETEEFTKDKDGNIVKEEDKKEDGEYTTEEKPINSDEVKNTENYLKTKEILEKRLKQFGVNQYNTRLDEEDGKIIIEIPENTETDHTVSNFYQTGKFEIVDSKNTDNVLMDNSDIKNSRVMYNSGTNGTTVLLSIEFNKEGTEKLKNISTEYAKKEEATSNTTSEDSAEASEEKEAEEQKEVTMQIDGSKMITSSFSEPMENGKLQLTMGQASKDTKKIEDYVKSGSTVAAVLDTGNLPIKYELDENEFIASDITTEILIKAIIIAVIIAGIALLIWIIKFKSKGILAIVEYIGFVAVYLLLIRYTNVIITLEGITAIAITLILNYVYNYKILNQTKNAEASEKQVIMKNVYLEFLIKVIPVCILSIVFCFISWTPISSFGMTMFWGLLLMAIYNITVTKNFLKN